MNNFSNRNWNNNQQNNQNNQQQSNQQPQVNDQTQQNQQSNNQTPGLMQTLLNATLPALLRHFTGGQQVPLGGNNSSSNSPETQLMLSQILMLQDQIIVGQQDLTNRIVNLETRASQQFNGLVKQVQNLSSVRLTSEKKQIDYNLPPENETNKY